MPEAEKSTMSLLENAKSHLKDLVAFDTTSRYSNRPLIDHMAAFLREYGIEPVILLDETGEKANLIARIGPADVPGVVLSGHTDVVPALEKGWTSGPFDLTERDGKLYGRGSCDMKGFAACVMAMVPQLAAAKLERPVWLCFSHDEEVGCLGAPAIAEWLAALDVPPMLAIIGEPTDMTLVTGQKGKIAMRCHVHGTSGHSSFAPDHVNAIDYAARIVSMIAERGEQIGEEGPFDRDFTVPHSTMLATMISGGVATNVTPDLCSFTFEIRSLPTHDARAELESLKKRANEEILPKMQAKCAETGIEWEEIFAYPAMGDSTSTDGFAFFRDIMPEWSGKVSYGSEGGVFETIGGIPSVIVGPGSIRQAHKPDEFVAIEQLDLCLDFLGKVARKVTEPA
ncbi:acetylornithine deacetylase [Nitratireductor aquimarinus]|nr:acetylornithine deacetylase [Nitratireductor aquimarinus]MBN7760801.1 acetylornithine deacetylase [Nitratireductor aquibiodomus]MBY6001873.1 acetylornithine deacetylase [Tritonibacter mobilis]MBY6024158.1 acetylornithine deacetylase [Nitratireductor sp. DP7N14-4]MCV0349604.1 acetylornithine deacetylase [Nitratireductor sp.]